PAGGPAAGADSTGTPARAGGASTGAVGLTPASGGSAAPGNGLGTPPVAQALLVIASTAASSQTPDPRRLIAETRHTVTIPAPSA
ncbi:MAG: hypothetical protein O2930_14775, partial [Acidobacteria bacterium]|nr:hypothetical protein [Acidobacteriota bacterium]